MRYGDHRVFGQSWLGQIRHSIAQMSIHTSTHICQPQICAHIEQRDSCVVALQYWCLCIAMQTNLYLCTSALTSTTWWIHWPMMCGSCINHMHNIHIYMHTHMHYIHVWMHACIHACIALHFITLNCMVWHDITCHYMAPHYMAWHGMTWHDMTYIHYITLPYLTLLTLRYIVLHYIALHYIHTYIHTYLHALQYIHTHTYVHTYILHT